MSTYVMGWVFAHSTAAGNDRLVLLAIADEADDDGTQAFPSVERIANKARVPKRTALRCLMRLEEAGELVVHRPEKRGRGHFNTYVVTMGTNMEDHGGAANNGAKVAPFDSTKDHNSPTEKVRNGAERRAALANPSQTHRPIDLRSVSEEPLALVTRAHDEQKTLSLPAHSFDEFWSVYPRRTAKGAALTAWHKAIKRAQPVVILEGAVRFRDDPNRDPAFTPHPATWLNADRWLDDPEPPRPAPARQSRHEASYAAILATEGNHPDRYVPEGGTNGCSPANPLPR